MFSCNNLTGECVKAANLEETIKKSVTVENVTRSIRDIATHVILIRFYDPKANLPKINRLYGTQNNLK